MLDNDDNSIVNVWSLSEQSNWGPVLGSWQEGRVQIDPQNEEKEYQVIILRYNRAKYYTCSFMQLVILSHIQTFLYTRFNLWSNAKTVEADLLQ